MEFLVQCPKCGGGTITEDNTATVSLEILSWEIEDGRPIPAEYDSADDAEWETSETPTPYACADCDWIGTLAGLRVTAVKEG